MKNIESALIEERLYRPTKKFQENCNITAEQAIKQHADYKLNPESFWKGLANQFIEWDKPFTKICSGSRPFFKWFEDGTLNVSKNCVDRHIKNTNNAIIHISENGEKKNISYKKLYEKVNRFSWSLKKMKLKEGDRVIIYMPTIPESIIAMLACARLGIIHSVVFAGFSSESLKDRIIDCNAKAVITVDGFKRSGKLIESKKVVDEAIEAGCECVKAVLIFNNLNLKISKNKIDFTWDEIAPRESVVVDPLSMNAEALLFILYTSGSTGKPKGIMHSSAGYLLNCSLTSRWVFDLKENDIFWCTADIGWVTGHSYVVYGPLSLGATILIYDGAPTYPDKNRFWKIIEENKVTVFYTAPTAIRTLMKVGEDSPRSFKLDSLRLLGTVGEPINPKAWVWYHKMIGLENCPIVDTWWQTETGANMIAPLPGISDLAPGTCTKPLPGIETAIMDTNGDEITNANIGGDLVIKNPWPSMLRGIWNDENRYKQTYWSKYNGKYYITGDTARYDDKGNIWIMGRSDDVVNISGHRLGTMEVESALVAHINVAEAAVVSYKHEIKGEAIHAFVSLKQNNKKLDNSKYADELRQWVKKKIGSIAVPERISFSDMLPKTRSGKIMRRLLRNLARGEEISGDTSTLENESVIAQLREIL